MGTLYLVRHAQASFGAKDDAGYDKLSDLGHQQSRWCGDYLKSIGFSCDHFAHGSLLRHKETMDGLFAGLDIEGDGQVEILSGLNEFTAHGIFEAYAQDHPVPDDSRTDHRTHFRTLRKALLAWSRGEVSAEGQETFIEFEARVEDALHRLCFKDADRMVLAVTSGGPIAQIIRKLLNAPVESMIELNLQGINTGISRIVFSKSKLFVNGFNAIPHLEMPDKKQFITYA